MKRVLENMPKEELIKLIGEQTNKLQEKDSKLQEKDSKLQEKDYIIAQLKRMLFGSKRERFEKGNINQLEILFEEYATDQQKQDETPVKETITYEREKPKKHKGRNKLPENLPIVEHVVEPQEDTSEMVRIGEERTEILEYTPAKFFKLVIVRPKYAVKEENQVLDMNSETNNVVIASLPLRPIPKCIAGNTLLSSILVNKYVDHLPLYRQIQIFKRAEITIPSSTIDSWITHLGTLFKPLWERLAEEIKNQKYLQADETTTKVLDNKEKGKTHLGYYWAYHAPLLGAVIFDYHKGRDKDAPRTFLENFKGFLQTDGYNVYRYYYSNKEVTHLACWAHARRKFEKALNNHKEIAEHVLIEIQKLYALERNAEDKTPEIRKELRLNQALPIINELGKYLSEKRNKVLPKSPIGLAIEYTTNLWTSLQSYLYDGNLKIDNNLIENKIRPIALGRKNYLFAGSHNGAERSAMFYSFFACCKLNNVEPMKWMNYVLANIAECPANKLHELLPHHINKQEIESFTDFWEV